MVTLQQTDTDSWGGRGGPSAQSVTATMNGREGSPWWDWQERASRYGTSLQLAAAARVRSWRACGDELRRRGVIATRLQEGASVVWRALLHPQVLLVPYLASALAFRLGLAAFNASSVLLRVSASNYALGTLAGVGGGTFYV